jgi:hypothetical protein
LKPESEQEGRKEEKNKERTRSGDRVVEEATFIKRKVKINASEIFGYPMHSPLILPVMVGWT